MLSGRPRRKLAYAKPDAPLVPAPWLKFHPVTVFFQGSAVSALEKVKFPLARQALCSGYPSMVSSPPYLKVWLPLTQVRLVLAVGFSSQIVASNEPPKAPSCAPQPPVFVLDKPPIVGKRFSS